MISTTVFQTQRYTHSEIGIYRGIEKPASEQSVVFIINQWPYLKKSHGHVPVCRSMEVDYKITAFGGLNRSYTH